MNQDWPTTRNETPWWLDPVFVVLVVVAGLALLVVVGFVCWGVAGPGRPAAVQALTRATVGANGPIGKALEAFEWDFGRYPTTTEGLAVIFKAPANSANTWRGPYLEMEETQLTDSWGNAFEYRCAGTHNPDTYDVWSPGPNGISEPDDPQSDDIGNW